MWKQIEKHSFTIFVIGFIFLGLASIFPTFSTIFFSIGGLMVFFGWNLRSTEKDAELKFEIENKEMYSEKLNECSLVVKFNFSNTGDKSISVKKLYLNFNESNYNPRKFEAFKIESGETVSKNFEFWLFQFLLTIKGEIIVIDTFDKKYIQQIECSLHPEPKK